ncbi:A disintegrin and metalloproteinase with thrombospondin motifs 20-like [Gigantopelta aegis]|uniref:A disintegrin and metalloproteinase with thrombospondin motifs 20-like n=1 Tax=Gigantopelta aegis TaxID=1735272 RepID=UPI001B889DDE|nr:A disintegrin and metalloproteinase with thrombospondin motifs 20-like [Gigantopelta aegis]
METETPTEYITLKHPNMGENPDKSDRDCTGHTTRSRFGKNTGKIVYTKVRIHILTMVADEYDVTFAKYYGKLKQSKKPIRFGHARDQYTKHYKRKKSKCGPIGTFDIDMRGTGLKVDDNLTWLPFGIKPYAEWSREYANATVHLRCGGFGGWCLPMELITFVPNPNDIY